MVSALEPGVAARLAAHPRPDQGRPPDRCRPPLPQLRPPTQRTWLRLQRTHYADLHPDQQRLLADIGLTREAAHARPLSPYAETAVEHARAYAAAHHTLAVTYSTVHDGFPLGRWLNDQRQQARRDTTPPARHQALTAIDPWWNPPWDLAWQRAYTRAPHDTNPPHRLASRRKKLDQSTTHTPGHIYAPNSNNS